MTSFYFDANYLWKLHWPEAGSPPVAQCAAAADVLMTALHGSAEFYSVGHRKIREGLATRDAVNVIFAQFRADIAKEKLHLLPITPNVLDHVFAVFSSAPSETFFRAADALHLATAAEHGFTEIFSNDRHLLAAAPLFGMRGINVVP